MLTITDVSMVKRIFQIFTEPEDIESKIAYVNFLESIKSEESKYKYGYSLLKYLEFLHLKKMIYLLF